MDKNSLSHSNSEISDGTLPFSLFHETSDKFANFIMRNGLGALNVIGENKIMKIPGDIVSILRESDIGVDLWEDENQTPFSLSDNMSDKYITAKI